MVFLIRIKLFFNYQFKNYTVRTKISNTGNYVLLKKFSSTRDHFGHIFFEQVFLNAQTVLFYVVSPT